MYQKLCLVVVQLRAHLAAAQRWTCLVAAVQRWTHLMVAVQRRTHLVVAVQRRICPAKWMVLDLQFSHLRYCFLLDAFLPGSYFLPLTVRWSFFSATAKSLVTCNCVHLELKSFFLIKKCAAAAKHLVGSLKSILANFGWKGHGSIKLQQFSSAISSGVSLSFSNLSSVGADKCGGIFN